VYDKDVHGSNVHGAGMHGLVLHSVGVRGINTLTATVRWKDGKIVNLKLINNLLKPLTLTTFNLRKTANS
jgi:hypothetical protein